MLIMNANLCSAPCIITPLSTEIKQLMVFCATSMIVMARPCLRHQAFRIQDVNSSPLDKMVTLS